MAGTSTAAGAAPAAAAASSPGPASSYPRSPPPSPRPPRRSPSAARGRSLLLLLALVAAVSASSAATAASGWTKGPRICTPAAPGFLSPSGWRPRASGVTSSGRADAVVVWGRKKKQQQQPPLQGGGAEGDEEEDAELLAIMGGGKGKKKGSRNKKSAPRPPVFTARIVLLGSPSPEWGADMRARLLQEGWMEDRVQVLPLPDPKDYSEEKWIAYMREGIKLRNATFVIAGGPPPQPGASAAAAAAPPAAAAQVLRFLEKHPLRGAILFGAPDQYALGKEPSGRAWDFAAVRRHCPFVGLVYPLAPNAGDDDGDGGWNPPPEAEAVREGLGLAPYPFGIRAPAPGQEYKAIEALIRDWQFLESLGMGPIQLVGEDEEEEEAALAKAISERDAAAGQQGADG